jgi:hypothetical protein
LKSGDPAAFDALEAADKLAWHARIKTYKCRAGLTQAKIQARLTRIVAEGWTFEVYPEEKFNAIMQELVQQARLTSKY